MSCSNCFNGCSEIQSDKCVRYTGENISELNINTGDSLLSVEQKIINFLISTLNGEGINPIVPESEICEIVQSNLPVVGPFTLNDYLTGLVKALCEIDDKITTLEEENPNTEYTLGCLTVSDNTNTHDVLQAAITKICAINTELTTLVGVINSTYVKISDINTYIENYLSTDPNANLISNRMVPFSIVPYAGSLSNFDASGAGIGNWNRIFLCNGNNGTPDLRGRVLVTTTTGMGGGALANAVDPAQPGNPDYTLGVTVGSNSVTLTEGQIPSHTHTATVSTEPDHTHGFEYPVSVADGGGDDDNRLSTSNNISSIDINETEPAGEHTHSVTINSTGGNQAHPNYQPGYGIYHIIYIPL
jgi:microcystin-dependent protein